MHEHGSQATLAALPLACGIASHPAAHPPFSATPTKQQCIAHCANAPRVASTCNLRACERGMHGAVRRGRGVDEPPRSAANEPSRARTGPDLVRVGPTSLAAMASAALGRCHVIYPGSDRTDIREIGPDRPVRPFWPIPDRIAQPWLRCCLAVGDMAATSHAISSAAAGCAIRRHTDCSHRYSMHFKCW